MRGWTIGVLKHNLFISGIWYSGNTVTTKCKPTFPYLRLRVCKERDPSLYTDCTSAWFQSRRRLNRHQPRNKTNLCWETAFSSSSPKMPVLYSKHGKVLKSVLFLKLFQINRGIRKTCWSTNIWEHCTVCNNARHRLTKQYKIQSVSPNRNIGIRDGWQ